MGNENSRSQYISKVSSSITREKSDASIQYKEIMKFKGFKRTKSDTASTSYNQIKNTRDENSSISINSEIKIKEDLLNIKNEKKMIEYHLNLNGKKEEIKLQLQVHFYQIGLFILIW